jgi:predicted kinase
MQQPTQPRILEIPDFALVLLIGVSGSGKSTFAARHFLPTEVLGSDAFRAWVSDDESSLEATGDAFDALNHVASIRLRRRRLVVVDATNVQPEARKPHLDLAAQHDALAVAIVLDVPEAVCQARNRARPERDFSPHVVRNQSQQLRRSLRGLRRAFLEEVAGAMERAGFWEEFETDWVCLDCELMPWSVKAQALLREQYAPVGAAAKAALAAAREAVTQALARLLSPPLSGAGGPPALSGADGPGSRSAPLQELAESLVRREEDAARYAAAYGRYCWETNGLDGIRLAPFHLLATEGMTYFDRDHEWHKTALAKLAGHSGLLRGTAWRSADLLDEDSQAAAAEWWRAYTESGGEGMVVKPREFVARGSRGLAQPSVKVRGREYLRIIYGPEYTEPHNLERLRQRSLGAKRSLAVREFALGVEGLERFARREPLRRVHECAFAVLALESEPVDPRLKGGIRREA